MDNKKKKAQTAQEAIAAAAAAIGEQLKAQALAASQKAFDGAVAEAASPTVEETVAALAHAANAVKLSKTAEQKEKYRAAYVKAVAAFAGAAKKIIGKSSPGWTETKLAFEEFDKVVALLGLVATHGAISPTMLSSLVEAAKAVQGLAQQQVSDEHVDQVVKIASDLVAMSDADLCGQYEEDEMPEAVAHAIDAAQLAAEKAGTAAKKPAPDPMLQEVASYEATLEQLIGKKVEEKLTKGGSLGEANVHTLDGTPYKPTSMPQVKQVGNIIDLATEPRTQKRAGIAALEGLDRVGRSLLGDAVLLPSVLAVMSPKRGDVEANLDWLRQCKVEPSPFMRLFFRPCPVKPRHGFVDSRCCTTWDEVREMYAESIKADADAEVLVMSELEAESSAVSTSTMVAVGPGNDGATAGKSSVVYDLPSPAVDSYTTLAARLKPDEDGYIESVFDGRHVHLVQLRGGPKQAPSASRIVPTPVPAVRYVEKAEGDLLEWEQRMAKVAAEGRCDKVVVWSPGGSALSHYAVHAVLNKIGISFEHESPAIGEPFEAPEGAGAVEDWDAHEFARGAARAILEAQSGRMSDKRSLSLSLAFAATGIHAAMSLRKGDSAELLGGACATLLMLSSAASCGESRHSSNVRSIGSVESNRHQVFVRSLADPLGSRPLLRLALDSFACDDWGGGYGGRKWAVCAAFAVDLEEALYRVVDEAFTPGAQPDVGKVVALAHRLLNAVHNGGKLLNKFGDPRILDAAAAGSVAFSTFAALHWHSISRGARRCSGNKVMETVIRIRSAGAVEAQAMSVWDSAAGDFIVGSAPAPSKYVLANGRAQVRIMDPKAAVLKIQYAFDVVQEKPPQAEVAKVVAAKKFKNLAKGVGGASPGGAKPGSAGSYTSITVKSMELLAAMVEHAQKNGGIDQALSMASTNTPYVKATKAEPLGHNAADGVRVFFGDAGVEVKP